jgi:RNA methyltransferase, TrmH family
LSSGLTLLEGERLVVEALRDGISFEAVVGTDAFWLRRMDLIRQFAAAGIHASKVSEKQMAMLTVTEHSAGILGVVARPTWSSEDFWDKTIASGFLGVLTVDIQDPGNLGTLIRTMAAANGSGMLLNQGNTEIGSPKILRSSAGAVFRLPTIEKIEALDTLAHCQKAGIQTLASVPKKGRPYTAMDWTLPTLLVLGGEGNGLSDEVIGACSQSIHIPMPGDVESLNVASAGAIMIYEAVRQRRLATVTNRRAE